MTKFSHTIHTAYADLDPAIAAAWEHPDHHGYDHSLIWSRSLAPVVCPDDRRIRIVSVQDETGVPRAVLPMALESVSFGPLSYTGLRGISNFYTALFGPIFFDAQPDSQVLDELVAGIKAIPGWSALDLNPLSSEDGCSARLAAALEQQGLFVHEYFRFANWYLTVDGRSFEEYRRGLPSALCETERRKRRRLMKNSTARIEVISGGDQLARALDDFSDVYAASWKRAEPHPGFIRDLAIAFARRGWLRLGVVSVDGQPVAAQIWFVCNGTASIFKLAHKSSHDALSAGSILTMHLMRHVIDEDGVAEVDFLAGDDAYKKHWMSARRERVGLRVYRRGTLAGVAGIVRARLAPVMRRIRKPANDNGARRG